MKEIKLSALHPCINSTENFIKHFNLEPLTQSFNFQWETNTPDYLIATEHIYKNKKLNRIFKNLYKKSKIKIFYAEEAMGCDWNIFDYGLGFDRNLIINDRYVQLPAPFDFFKNFIFNPENEIKTIEQAKILLTQKNKFCNFLYSNPKAHPTRDILFHFISQNYKKVDSLGKHLNNTNTKATGYIGHIEDCVLIKKPYKFSIACENAFYEGYTTEKILTSLQAHTIPIYFGNPLASLDINPKAFINVHDFNSLQDLLEFIKEIDKSDELWCQMIAEPWQTYENKESELKRKENYYNFINNIFSKEIHSAQRLPQGTYIDIYQNWFFNRDFLPSTFFEKVWHKLSSIALYGSTK